MQTYICKCGKTFEKPTNADTTGYVLQNFSPQHECYGCPYIVTVRDWVTQKIIKQECRATVACHAKRKKLSGKTQKIPFKMTFGYILKGIFLSM